MTTQTAAEAILSVHLFGPLDVRVQAAPLPHVRSRKVHWLLALLALRHGREVSREWLAGILWPDSELRQGYYNLRQALAELRRALGTEASRLYSPTPHTLTLDLTAAWVDVTRFDAALKRGDPASLEEAVTLYRGPLLEGCSEEWILPERTAREQACLSALEALAAHAAAKNDLTAAVSFLRRAISRDPYRESAYGALMQALTLGGDRVAVTQVYQDLRQRLHRELNALPSPETEALYRQLNSQETRLPPLPSFPLSPTTPPRYLPIPLSELIGRQEQIEEVSGWLNRCRLITLTGSGGVGKTRLAIAAASAVAEQFVDGVWFVDLAPLSDPALLRSVVAKTLGVQEERERSAEETLEQALSLRSVLLVLDNCEHLLEACALLVHRLLSACPSLRILATSRQSLGLTGEQVYRVPSLALPSAQEKGKNAGELLDYAAVRLFVERAQQANTAFCLNPGNAEVVVNLCCHLDGIPLALELAAARVRSLTVEDIRRKLDQCIRLLTGGDRTALPRQQTLRATVDWSYALLSDQERVLLARLSVFSGGWTLEAAEQVCCGKSARGTGIEEEEILPLMISLVEQSLVLVEGQKGWTRYWMLETVRQYAAEKLSENEETESLRIRHLDFFLALAEEAESQMQGGAQEVWLQRLESEHDNLHSALAWCLKSKDEIIGDFPMEPALLRLAVALWQFWALQGYWSEGRAYLAEALAYRGAQRPTPLRARALYGAGLIASTQSEYGVARTLLEQSLALFQELGEKRDTAQSLVRLGGVAFFQGHYEAATALRVEALTLFRALEDKWGIANALSGLGQESYERGDYETARTRLTESLELWRELESKADTAWLLWHLAVVARMEGHEGTAQTLLEEGLALCRELGNKEVFATSLCELGHVALRQGRYEEAKALLEESLPIFQKLGDRRGSCEALSNLGMVAEYEGNYSLAGSFYEQSWQMGRGTGHRWPLAVSLQGLGYLAWCRNEFARARIYLEQSLDTLGVPNDRWIVARSLERFARLVVAQGQMKRGVHLLGAAEALCKTLGRTPPVAIAEEYYRTLDTVRVALGEEAFIKAWEEGRALTWEQATDYALENLDNLPTENEPIENELSPDLE